MLAASLSLLGTIKAQTADTAVIRNAVEHETTMQEALDPILPEAKLLEMGFGDTLKSPGMDLIVQRVGPARLVFTGENHSYSKFNSMLEYVMMRNLYEQKGFNRFLIELSPARAHYMNRYICDGDSAALAALRSMTGYRYMDMFRAMRAWMQDVPKDQQIRIIGIDVERFTDLPMLRLHEILPKSNIPDNLKAFVETLHQMGAIALDKGQVEYRSVKLPHLQGLQADADFECTLAELVERYADSLDASMKAWLGDDYAGYAEAMGWLKEYQRWEEMDDLAQQYAWREEHMYQNLKAAMQAEPAAKFFGQFGRCHIGLTPQQQDCGWFEYHSVMNRMKERYFQNDSMVLSIGVFYRGEMDAISTNDPSKRQAIRDEITAMTGYESPETYVFDIRDSSARLPLLAEKFNLALLHSEEIEGLEVDTTLDASYYGEGNEDGTESSAAAAWLIFEPMGFQNFGIDYSTMANHFAGLSKPFEQEPNPLMYNYALAYRGQHLGLRLEQGLFALDVYNGLDGRMRLAANSTSLGLFADINLGSNLVLSPCAGVGQYTDKLHWYPTSPSLLNPDTRERVSVVSHQNFWNAGFSVGYQIWEMLRLSVFANMQAAFQQDLQYYYKGTLNPYLSANALGQPLSGYNMGLRLEFLFDVGGSDEYDYEWITEDW